MGEKEEEGKRGRHVNTGMYKLSGEPKYYPVKRYWLYTHPTVVSSITTHGCTVPEKHMNIHVFNFWY